MERHMSGLAKTCVGERYILATKIGWLMGVTVESQTRYTTTVKDMEGKIFKVSKKDESRAFFESSDAAIAWINFVNKEV